MVAHNTDNTSGISIKNGRRSVKTEKRAESMGYCLKCGAQISFCGKPFSAEIACLKCGAVNVWEESQQPKFLKHEEQHSV